MIRFTLKPAPANFDDTTRLPGQAWYTRNAATWPEGKRPPDYWSIHSDHLGRCFEQLCGYSMMLIPDGTVDHFLSCHYHLDKAYEWENYRYVSGRVNSRKQDLDDRILDPFEIDDDWLEIDLRSFQLVLHLDRVPADLRDRAQNTYTELKLANDRNLVNQRITWYDKFYNGHWSLGALDKSAPLIAKAVRQALTLLNPDALSETDMWFRKFWQGRIPLIELDEESQDTARTIRAHLPAVPPYAVSHVRRRIRRP